MAGLTQRGCGRRSPHRRGALGTASGRHRAGLLRIQIQRNLINHTFILVCHLNPAPSAGLWGWQNELKEKRGTRGCREHCGVGAPAGPRGLGTGQPGQLGEERNGPEAVEGKKRQQRKGHQSLPWPVTAAPTRTQSRVVPARSYRHQGGSPCPQQHDRAGWVPEPQPRLGLCSWNGNTQQQTLNPRGSLPVLPVPTNPAGLLNHAAEQEEQELLKAPRAPCPGSTPGTE